MKRFFLIFLTLAGMATAFSQDYQCIKDDATYYFSDSTNFKAIQIDSVVLEGENLVYYNFPAMTDEPDGDCYSRFGPSWIGRKVTVEPDGDHIFYNKYDEPITINTFKDTGEFWTAYQFSSGNYTVATIAEIAQMEFLGLIDSVKKVSFQTYSSNGNPISYPTNSKFLLISKSYGLVRTINFKLFPNHSGGLISAEYCSEYDLVGISDPPLGVQNLTAAQVYDFDVGDEIHTYYEEYYSWGNYVVEGFNKKYYLQKDFAPNLDSVIYLIHSCGYQTIYEFEVGTTATYFNDTIVRKYNIGDDSIIDIIPEKVIIDKSLSDIWQYSVTNCRYFENTNQMIKTKMAGLYSIYPHDCIFIIWSDNDKDLGNDMKYYIEGLGSYYFYTQVSDHTEFYEPIYFKKGEEEWGTPYSFNCEDFITSTTQNTISTNEVTIAPNPMQEWTKIKIIHSENSQYHLSLFNSFGKQIKEFDFAGSEFLMMRDNLQSGIYFYLIEDNKGFRASGKLVIR